MASFEELGLHPSLLRALDKREYEQPTPVQVPQATFGAHTLDTRLQ